MVRIRASVGEVCSICLAIIPAGLVVGQIEDTIFCPICKEQRLQQCCSEDELNEAWHRFLKSELGLEG